MKLSLAQQLGHIGSEISRARHWEMNNDRLNRDRALARSLEILDLTLDDRRWKTRLKELTRLREVIGDWFCEQKKYEISMQAIEDYCIHFALIAKRPQAPENTF